VARLYSNENFPLQVVEALRAYGHDVVTIQERGKANEAVVDPEVLQFAISEGRAVLTLNRFDFIRLHRQHQNHAGIIVCTVDSDFASQATRIHEALLAKPDLPGELIRVNRSKN
jgi:predicted nuclease of predicted toxin-antitoxin system